MIIYLLFLEFESTVINLLTQLLAHVNQHAILLNEINRHTSSINSDKLIAPSNLPDFPINSLNEFNNFEGKVFADTVVKDYMVNIITDYFIFVIFANSYFFLKMIFVFFITLISIKDHKLAEMRLHLLGELN